MPGWGLVVFLVLILCGLASTGDSALCAGGSLITVDIYKKYLRPESTQKDQLKVSRLAILGLSILATCIALIPGITILSLFLFYGTLRSATFMPTLLVLFRKKMNPNGLFFGIAFAVIFGLPTYLVGQFSGNVDLKVGANIGIVIISLVFPLLGNHFGKKLA